MSKIVEVINNIDSNNAIVYALYFLIVLIIILILYTLYTYIDETDKKKKALDFDLARATKALDNLESKPVSSILPLEYQQEEEDAAIISYDELVEKTMSIPTILETTVNESDEYEENVPITIDEFKKNAELKEVVSFNFHSRIVDEKEYLKDLKKFRAGLK